MQEEAPGMVFWHANGWTIYQVLEQYMRKSSARQWLPRNQNSANRRFYALGEIWSCGKLCRKHVYDSF